MLIVCPSCASSYSLTREQLGSGRKLKCAACRHQWIAHVEDALPEAGEEMVVTPAPVSPEPAFEPVFETLAEPVGASADSPAIEAEPRRRTRPAPRRREAVSLKARLSKVMAAVRRTPPSAALVGVLVLLAVAAVIERKPVVRLLPQTARLYAALGMPVNLRGLAFQDVRSEIVADREQNILVVEGTIRAVAGSGAEVPPLQLSIRGPEGQEVYAWTAEAPALALKAGETTPFRARLVAPPAESRDVVIRFAARDAHATPLESPPSPGHVQDAGQAAAPQDAKDPASKGAHPGTHP